MAPQFSVREIKPQAVATLAWANVQAMGSAYIRDVRRERLRSLLAEFEGKPSLLAARLERSPSQISQWLGGHRTINEDSARAIEARLRKPRGWLDQTQGKDVAHAASSRKEFSTAQDLSRTPDRFDVPLVSWEQIVSGVVLDELYRTVIKDDALGRDYPRGHEIVWSTVRPPRIGRPVLIKDAHGQLHNRIYTQGRAPGEWIAEAYAPGYRSFDSEAGLDIIGVFKGLLEPDD